VLRKIENSRPRLVSRDGETELVAMVRLTEDVDAPDHNTFHHFDEFWSATCTQFFFNKQILCLKMITSSPILRFS
jgi:hypothetical protein